MLVPLNLPPGVYGNGTDYQSSGRWRAAHAVRWFEGTLRPIGGWTKKKAGTSDAQVSGKARGAHAWRGNAGQRYMAIGTHSKLYILTDDATALYDITPSGFTVGVADADYNLGYGGGSYGSGAYGALREDSGSAVQPTTWQLDNFGQVLVGVCTSDGKYYKWTNTLASAATAVTASAGTLPTGLRGVVCADQRFVLLLGRRTVYWPDLESLDDFEIVATKQGGNFELNTTGELMAGRKVRGGDVLLLTNTDAHLARYVGPPFVWGFERIGEACGLLAPNAVTSIGSIAAWMGQRNFYVYDGSIRALPSEVSDRVFGNLNTGQRDKVAAITNQQYGEFTWYYPSGASTENDRYVSWNYRDDIWTEGAIARTTGVDRGVFSSPILVDPSGYIYDHENGFSYAGAALPFAEGGPLELPPSGDRAVMCRWLVPDEVTTGGVSATFTLRMYPNSPSQVMGPYALSARTPVRFAARQLSLKIQGTGDMDWRWGVPRLDLSEGSRR